MGVKRPKVQSEDIPQANRLRSIRAVVQAVAVGAITTRELEACVQLRPRHVRYYLVAARTLGWITRSSDRPMLTEAGRSLLETKVGSLEECDAIASAIWKSHTLAIAVGGYLMDEKMDRAKLTARLLESTELSTATAARRAACLVAWRLQLLDQGWRPERLGDVSLSRGATLSTDDLSVRARGVLRQLGIETMSDLDRLSAGTLVKTRNCGRKTTREIIEWAAALVPKQRGPSASVEAPDCVPVELLIEVSNFELSVRAQRYIEAQGIQRVGDLVSQTEADLLRGKNCGRKTLKELKAALSRLGLSLGMSVPAWNKTSVEELVAERTSELGRARQRLRRQIYGIDSSAGLETEVASAIAAVVKPRARPKVELWMGLDQPVPPTLQQVAEVADVTRERIRQIVSRAQSKLDAANLDMEQLEAALRYLEGTQVLSGPAAIAGLTHEGLSDGRVTVRGLLRAAELFGVPHELQRVRVGDVDFIGRPAGLELIKVIGRVARRAVEHWGCSTLEDVAAQASSQAAVTSTPELARDVLMTHPGFRLLDAESGWFWLADVPRNRLLNKIDKILAASSEVDLAALRAGIARHYRMEGFSPPTRVLLALCEQLGDCEVVGRLVVDKRPRLPEDELSEHEQTMLAVFREHGPVLSYTDAMQYSVAAGLNEITTGIYLGNSPILRRVAVGIYTLVGASTNPGQVEAVANRNARSRKAKVLQDFGWSTDGSAVWATYRVSESVLRSGVMGVPAGIKKYLTEDGYDLHGLDGAKLGRVGLRDASMWGFSPFFRRRGGEVGDHMRVTFNLSAGIATAEISEEPFAEES